MLDVEEAGRDSLVKDIIPLLSQLQTVLITEVKIFTMFLIKCALLSFS